VGWPTVALALGTLAAWCALQAVHARIGSVGYVVASAAVGCLHLSLQHEAVHGHPFRSRRANAVLAGWPLALWLPFGVYRRQHLAHHATPDLTDPIADPESFHVTPERWAGAGRVGRALLVVQRTLVGRLALGPVSAVATSLRDEARRVARRDAAAVRTWAVHLPVAALVVAVAVGAFGVPWWQYALGWTYGALALSLLRSFAEHRAVPVGTRAAVVRTGPLLSLLFLNTNLHETHHRFPGVAWYELPAVHERTGGDAAAAAGAGLYRGYREVVARHALRPFDHPVDPLAGRRG
jgi:fatty acid desaturase